MAHRRSRLSEMRAAMRAAILEDESGAVLACVDAAALTCADRASIFTRAIGLVRTTRARAGASIMQGFLAEYGLSTREGVALMCLAEALLRVPDTETIDALIEDKIGASDWGAHLGHSSSPLVNASTWALLLTGKVLGEAEEGLAGALHEAIRRLGEPVIRAAVAQAMRELGHQFVLGRDMREATTPRGRDGGAGLHATRTTCWGRRPAPKRTRAATTSPTPPPSPRSPASAAAPASATGRGCRSSSPPCTRATSSPSATG